MWFAGLAAQATSLAKVGVVVWQPLQSPLVGWALSTAVGRESPAVVEVLGGLAGGAKVAGKGGGGRVAAVAVPARRVELIQRRRTGVSGRGGGARQHPQVGRALVTGLTGADRRPHRRMARNTQCRARDARGAELEATGVHVRRGVPPRPLALQAAHRQVIAARPS